MYSNTFELPNEDAMCIKFILSLSNVGIKSIFCDGDASYMEYDSRRYPYFTSTNGALFDCKGDNPDIICDCCDCNFGLND